MKLRLGIATYNYIWRYTLEETLERIARLGFKILELMSTPPQLWPRDFKKNDRERLRELLRSYGMQAKALNPTFGDLNLASPRPTVRKLALEELKEHVELARDIDAEMVVVVPGARHMVGTPPMERVWNNSKNGIRELALFAEDHGITIGLEHAPFRFIETAEQLRRMIEEVGLDSIKAVFDTSNICLREPPPSAIQTLGDLIAHVHLADNDCKTWAKLPIGRGVIDFGAVANALREINFNGASILELWYPEDTDEATISSKRKLEALGWSA